MVDEVTVESSEVRSRLEALFVESGRDVRVAEVRTRARSAAIWSVANTIVVRFVGIVTTVVLARIIAPTEFGVFAVALVVFNIVISISEMGVSVALVRTTENIDRMAPTVTTVAWISSACLCTICVVLAGPLALAMGAPEASALLRVMALGILVAGISAVPAAITQRDFRQDRKAIAEISAVIISLALAVPMALAGWGAWALVWSRLVGLVVTAIVLIVATEQRYRPGFSRSEARRLVRFGFPLAGASLLVLGVVNLDNVVVSRELGVEQLAFYSLAFNVSSWPVAAFSAPARNVSVAWLANMRSSGVGVDDGLAQFLRPLMVVTIPTCVGLALLSSPLIFTLYGSKWAPAAAPLTVLAILGAVRVLLEVGYDALVSDGRSAAILLIHSVWLTVLIPALVLGAQFGLQGVAWAQVVTIAAVVSPLYLWILRRVGVRPLVIFRAMWRPLFGGLVMGVVGISLRSLISNPFAEIGVVGLAGITAYALVVSPSALAKVVRIMCGRASAIGGVHT